MQLNSSKITSLGWVLFLCASISLPVNAHETERTGNVGATLHIEPDDSPRAGETALTWFALTQRGGKIIPLEQCNCQLALYPKPHQEGTAPLQQPQLKAVSVSRYENIPGADITFPAAGAYELELTGAPKAGANFPAFKLEFDVNVAPGAAAPSASAAPVPAATTPVAESSDRQPTWLTPAIAIAVILTPAIAWLVWRNLNANQKN
ncbi:hypothetical protein [Aliterella atlantica]|uniref:hypothetical protein n=1 Tax=Aliterella atlantica TaxID=1827278 RepID=UPI00190FF85B|nr:hypothetical protein [Aliterella atlantica]